MADLTGFMPEETGAEQVRVETFFKPNLDLIIAALGARQQRYNTNLDAMAKVKAKVDEVNSLEGFDRNRYYQKQEEYEKEIDKLMSMYEGDLSKASGDLRVLTSKVGKDFGIHGEMTAINERALGYMANKKELDKRYQEKKITDGQYFKLQQELEATKDIGIGTDPKAYRGWRKITPMDAVDFDEFATKFINDFKADYTEQKGWTQTKDANGFIIWEKEGHETVKYEDVLRDLSISFRNAAEKTGQLRDDFDYHIYKNRIDMNGEEYIKKYTDLNNSTEEELKLLSIKKPNKDQVEQIQNLINKYATNKVKVDGIIGTDDEEYIKLLKPSLEERKKTYTKSLEDLKIMNNDQLKQYYYGDYLKNELTRLADPYADKAAYDKIKTETDRHIDPMFQFQLDLQKERYKIDYQKAVDNTLPTISMSEGIELLGPEEHKDLNKALNGLQEEQKTLQAEADLAYNKNEMVKYNTLNERLKSLNTKIANVTNAMFEVNSKMRENGMTGNDELVEKRTKFYLEGFGGKWSNKKDDDLINYHTYHTAFLSGIPLEDRKKIFGETDIIKIKNLYKSNPQNMLSLNSKISKYYDQNPSQIKTVNNWISSNLYNNDLHTTYEIVSEPIGGALYERPSTVIKKDPIKNLQASISYNTTKYMEKSKDNIFYKSSDFYIGSDKNSRIGKLQEALKNALKSNTSGFYDINGVQASIARSGEVFYNEAGKVVPTGQYDLSKVEADEIAISQKSINGDLYIKVPIKGLDGKQLFRKTKGGYEKATMIIRPAGTSNYNLEYSKIILENINTIKTIVTNNLSGYSKEKLNSLTEGEYASLFGTYDNDFSNHLGSLASVNFLNVLEKQGAYKIPTGSAREVNIAGKNVLLIHGVPQYKADGTFKNYTNEDVWTISSDYGYVSDVSDPSKPSHFIPKKINSFVEPSLITSVTGKNAKSVSQFQSVYDLSKALEFNLNGHY